MNRRGGSGDDQAFKHDAAYVDDADAIGSVAFLLRHIGDGRPLAERVKAGVGFLADGRHELEQMYTNHWRAASAFSEDLGLSDAVRDSVSQTFERWDGKGEPDGIKGEEVLQPARLVHLADRDILVQQILPLAPGLVEKLENGTRVADVACGSGNGTLVMARRSRTRRSSVLTWTPPPSQ
jgi:hypothetical protein